MGLFRRKPDARFARSPVVAPPTADQLQQERTGRQQGFGFGPAMAPMLIGSAGIDAENPCGFSCWNDPCWGTPFTYRRILQHPVIRLARQIAIAPVLSNSWTIKRTAAGTEQAESLIRDCLLPQRRKLVELMVSGLDMGCAPGEKVWEVRDRHWWVRVKPLLRDITWILTDPTGNFAGLSQNGITTGITAGVNSAGAAVAGLGPYKAFLYTHDGTDPFYGLYGRSRLENVREYAWRPWLRTMQDLARLRTKLSGVLGMGFAPEIFAPDGHGGQVSMWDRMKDAVKALMGYGFALIPTFEVHGGPPTNAKDLAEMFKFQFYDAGNHSAAIAGYLADLAHKEGHMFNGLLRSSRTGLEGQHGTKAEAVAHTDTGMTDSELIDDDFAATVQQQLVDDLLVMNFGENARGTVTISAPPIVDARTAFRRDLLRQLVVAPPVAMAVARILDMKQQLATEEMPLLENIEWAIELMQPTPPPPHEPGQNGNGRMTKQAA